ncbi:MAG: hypothetical protein JWN95_2870 [Frankiales bacterium]|nr:hypothetical protein [Frankiales bacterium]
MFTILCLALILLAIPTASRRSRRKAERNGPVPDVLAQAFPAREMRELDAHLEEIALDEQRSLEREVARYLTGVVGYVVRIHSMAPNGIAFELSDGRRLALAGVSRRTQQILVRCTAEDLLQPTHVDRDAFSYCLRLRGHAGTDIDIYARKIALAL